MIRCPCPAEARTVVAHHPWAGATTGTQQCKAAGGSQARLSGAFRWGHFVGKPSALPGKSHVAHQCTVLAPLALAGAWRLSSSTRVKVSRAFRHAQWLGSCLWVPAVAEKTVASLVVRRGPQHLRERPLWGVVHVSSSSARANDTKQAVSRAQTLFGPSTAQPGTRPG